jgi:hypothetical protein
MPGRDCGQSMSARHSTQPASRASRFSRPIQSGQFSALLLEPTNYTVTEPSATDRRKDVAKMTARRVHIGRVTNVYTAGDSMLRGELRSLRYFGGFTTDVRSLPWKVSSIARQARGGIGARVVFERARFLHSFENGDQRIELDANYGRRPEDVATKDHRFVEAGARFLISAP